MTMVLSQTFLSFIIQKFSIQRKAVYSGTSIKVAENVVAKFSLKKGVVSIVRAEKVEKSRSI